MPKVRKATKIRPKIDINIYLNNAITIPYT